MNIKRFGLAAAGAAVAFGSLFAATPATAAISGDVSIQETCRAVPYNESTPGGWTQYNVTCNGNTVTIAGYVYDSSADNRCIRVKAVWPSENRTDYSRKACPKGTNQSFVFTGLYAANPKVSVYSEPASG
ncbi:hypothetical protein [Amycolatopsis sp. lyj-90]|uniref:hypothetical protein n=1 Tax=Amycolatopsis sp. lyj-90 TaxID=2789285 RepID=UPI00397C2262